MRVRDVMGVLALAMSASGCESSPEVLEPPGVRIVVSRVEVFPPAALVEIGRSRTFATNVVATIPATVFWSVDGGAGNGTITQDGVYTAPEELPVTATVTVRATAVEDPTTSGVAEVTVVGEGEGTLTVQVLPVVLAVQAGKPQAFSAFVTGIDTTVTWSVDGGIQYGVIDADGIYTAPLWIPYPRQVTVRAVSNVDSDVFGLATVTVVPAES